MQHAERVSIGGSELGPRHSAGVDGQRLDGLGQRRQALAQKLRRDQQLVRRAQRRER